LGVYSERPGPTGIRENWHELAGLLCDQFAALGYRRPAVARLVSEGDVLLLLLGWSEQAGGSLDVVAPSLAELVTMDLHQEVTDLGTSVTTDGCRAIVSFVMGSPVEASSERFEAVKGWCNQVHRNARRQQACHRQRRRELTRLRAEMTTLRAELRAQR
jgi:hypothetical protein